jgi:hypothetical protein
MERPLGANRTKRVGPTMSVPRGRPEAADTGQNDAIDPKETLAALAAEDKADPAG